MALFGMASNSSLADTSSALAFQPSIFNDTGQKHPSSTTSTLTLNTSSPSGSVYVPEKLNDLPVYGFFLIGLLFFSLLANLLIALCVMGVGRNKRSNIREKGDLSDG